MHIMLDNPALRNYHGLINYIDIKANVKMSSFKTIYLQRNFAAVPSLILLHTFPPNTLYIFPYLTAY
jgi:hypothetical protein